MVPCTMTACEPSLGVLLVHTSIRANQTTSGDGIRVAGMPCMDNSHG